MSAQSKWQEIIFPYILLLLSENYLSRPAVHAVHYGHGLQVVSHSANHISSRLKPLLYGYSYSLYRSAGVFCNLYKTLESISVSQKIIYYEHSVFRSKEFPGYYYLVSGPLLRQAAASVSRNIKGSAPHCLPVPARV